MASFKYMAHRCLILSWPRHPISRALSSYLDLALLNVEPSFGDYQQLLITLEYVENDCFSDCVQAYLYYLLVFRGLKQRVESRCEST